MSPSRVPLHPLLAAALASLCAGAFGCATPQPEPHRSAASEEARARAEEAQARADEARAHAEELQAERDAARAQAEAEQARRERAAQLANEWKKRFAGKSAVAQEAFKTRKFIPGMSREELKLLVEYRRAAGEQLELKRVGEREEIGKKRDTWIYCQPDCDSEDQIQGTITFENDVLTAVQTGWVAP